MAAVPHELGIVAKDTVGGFFTVMVCAAEVTDPQELDVVTLIAYVPASVKLKDGFGDEAEVPFV